MAGMLVLGLPLSLRRRLESAAKKEKTDVSLVLADTGKEGTFRLVPDPSMAVHQLRAYFDECGNRFEDMFIVALPYAPIPGDVDRELAIFEECGGKVVRVTAGADDWPAIPKRGRADARFSDELYDRLADEIFGDSQELPSEYFALLAARHPKLLITKGALDNCDEVAEHRWDFLRNAADAFVKLVDQNGRVGRVDSFFASLGLDHAQSGGITTTLAVLKDGKCVYRDSGNTHLKQGDNTTPQAAARIYYQLFFVDGRCYVALLYAGPHPESNIAVEHELG